MKPNEPVLQPLNDAEAARRALKLLAERKIVPTPETFADAFWESSGVEPRGARATERARAWQRLALRSLRALEQACTDDPAARDKLRECLAQTERAGPQEALQPAPALTDCLLAIEREIAEDQRVRAGLQRLLGLLCENLGQLAPDEAWLVNQLEPVRSLLAGPMRSGQIAAAERRLAALIAQQTGVRRGLQEAKVALTEMLSALLDRVGEMGTSAEQFNNRVSTYQQQLQQSPDLTALSRIVHGLLDDTQVVQDQIQSSRADLAEARNKVEIYEARVSQLEHQLSEVSTLVQKDPLTNALNRRGLEHAFRVESARALRYGTGLTLGMMDLDNFKRINDTLGHVAGDRALVHFVTTVHATMRPTDLTARTGGEEFAVLFPACAAQDGVEATERLQRELARRPFQFEQDRLTLAFSAGIAQWRPGESLEQLMRRADASLYEAKNAGKNRVIKAV